MAEPLVMSAITHVAVTVTDLSVSVPWYSEVLGTEPVLDEDTGPYRHVIFRLGNTLFGLHQFPELITTDPFDERRPGLDHIAFDCESAAHLTRWERRLDELGVRHGGIVGGRHGSGLSFRDPDNIALELWAPRRRAP